MAKSETLETFSNFIKGTISEETFFSSVKISHNYLLELELIKKDIGLFRKFLLRLSLEGRMRILLHSQLLGISQEGLWLKYGITKDKLRTLKGQLTKETTKKNAYVDKNKIRSITLSEPISKELYANLAIFVKLPVSWIKDSVPDSIWSNDHFHHLRNSSLTLDQFYSYLNSMEEKAITPENLMNHRAPNNVWFYDIRGVILELNNSHKMYLRASIFEFGGFIIEIFSKHDPIYNYNVLKEILRQYDPIQTGYFETVIKNRINPAIVCKSRSKRLDKLIDLKPFGTL